jgi:hypothetical protein
MSGLAVIRPKYNFPRGCHRGFVGLACVSAGALNERSGPVFHRSRGRFPPSQMDSVSVEKLVQGQRSL